MTAASKDGGRAFGALNPYSRAYTHVAYACPASAPCVRGVGFDPLRAPHWPVNVRKIRIVIADDHPAFRHVLQHIIEGEPDMSVVAAVGDGVAALDVVRRLAPDVAVLDVRMPGLDGIEVVRRLADDRLPTRTVIVTMQAERVVFDRAIAAGASGYVLKDTAMSEVVEAVRTVARGETDVAAAMSARFGHGT